MKLVKFHSEAEFEMVEAAKYYESQQKDLGKRFLEAVQSATKRLQINPALYTTLDKDIRCCKTRTFPYGIIFREQSDIIEIIAVMHFSREPDYWRKRI